MEMVFESGLIPLRVISSANVREHWRVKYKRDKELKESVIENTPKEREYYTLPCQVTLTRVSPRTLDDDNLGYAFKAVRDQICDIITPGKRMGMADSDKRIHIKYDQEKSKNKIYGFKLKIESEINDD